MKKEYLKNRAGVSLITVLMFMLVATIAATAIWKFISSEGFSSTSRMLKREAYQSAQAGIENARSWMTFHANDVGGLIRQFRTNNGLPIKLDDQLRPLQKAGQNYHVWLTGVNVDNATYKLKIVSSGEARNNTRHTEAAVFNVDGLYRVQVPQQRSAIKFDYTYFGGSVRNHGDVQISSMLINGHWSGNPANVDKNIIITGNAKLSGDKVNILGTGCIGGNLYSGNGVDAQNIFVGGDAKEFHAKTYGIGNHAYFDGNVEQHQSKPIKIGNNSITGGNVTLNGNMRTYMKAGNTGVSIKGNLCLGTNAHVQIGDMQDCSYDYGYECPQIADTFKVRGDVWTTHPNSFYSKGGDFSNRYSYLFLGDSSISKVYAPDVHAYNDYVTLRDTKKYSDGTTPYVDVNVNAADQDSVYYFYTEPGNPDIIYSGQNYQYNDGQNKRSPYCTGGSGEVCHVTPWFKSKGSITNTLPDPRPVACADSVKQVCDEIWIHEPPTCPKGRGQDMGDIQYRVDDILTTAYQYFEPYASKGCAAGITEIDDASSDETKDFFFFLNDCYNENNNDAEKKEKNLYNGYLVVKVQYHNMKQNYKQKLQGHFIIILDNYPNETVVLPPTDGNNDFVFVYIKEGAFQLQGLDDGSTYNYFFYTPRNVGTSKYNYATHEIDEVSGGFLFNKDNFHGSIYAVADSCARVSTLTTEKEMQYNPDLLESLTDSHVICESTVANCGDAAAQDNPQDPNNIENEENRDPYYISMAPQLGVSLESQNKSFEDVEKLQNDGSSLAPSFIVLPRVITLPSDPYGSLGDYFSVMSLNSAAPLAKADLSLQGACTKVNGNAALDIGDLNSKLYDPGVGNKLPKGSYKCNIAAKDFDNPVPVWLVIENKEMRNLHEISFAVASQDIGSTGSKDVMVRLKPNIPSVRLKVACPIAPSQWSYKDLPAGVVPGNTCEFTVSNNGDTDKLVKLFAVETDGATSGSMNFQLMLNGNGNGNENDYILGSPSITSVYMSSVASLYRSFATSEQISAYCDNHAEICPTRGGRDSWPDCEIDANETWVEPYGAGFKSEIPNESWLITSALNTTVRLRDVSSGKCVVVIPENESCTFSDAEKTCTLPASVKKKVNKIKFKFKNVETRTNPFFTVTSGDISKTCYYEISSGGSSGCECLVNAYDEHICTVNVYDGDSISMKIESDYDDNQDFRYWKCEGGSCPVNTLNSDSYPPFILSDNETAVTLMFNEIDKHCFFDKFKSRVAACEDLRDDEKKEYCIDYCNSASGCESAAIPGSYSDSKWHLIHGSMDMIDYNNGKITVLKTNDKNNDITVMSTINADAGTQGTLKALVRLPKEQNSQSGFLLGSNANATSYLMLYVFIDENDKVKARVCDESLQKCEDRTLSITVSEEDMVMIEAEISADEITVMASKNTENSKVNVKYSLGYWSGSFQGSYVGFRIASPKFVLYGIGWKSKNYECFNTYPTIKCSFAAVGQDGVIPTDQFVKPWVGYSGWKEWSRNDCTEMYYYKGVDACNGDNYGYTSCGSYGYNFDVVGNGKHGYTDNSGNEIKTAKVGLDCQSNAGTYSSEEMMWANDTAHCGVFWTGAHNACTTVDKIDDEILLVASGDQSAAFSRTVNLRSAQLKVDVENPDGNEIKITLFSEGQRQGEEFSSEHVSMTAADTQTFDIESFVTESNGFDPGKVTRVHFENKGNSSVTIKGVSSKCETAVRVKSCSVKDTSEEVSGFWWFSGKVTKRQVGITAFINNRDYAESYKIVVQRKNTLHALHNRNYELTLNKRDVMTEGSENAFFALPKGHGNIDGLLDDWVFLLSVKADGSDEYSEPMVCSKASGETPRCEIEKPGPENNKEVVRDEVTFKANLKHCDGCSYIVELDNVTLKTGDCSKTTGMDKKCDINIPKEELSSLSVGDHTFRLYSPDGEFDSDACTRTFKATSKPGSINLEECTASVDGSSVIVNTSSIGCDADQNCTYRINPANATGDYVDNQAIAFSYNGSGTVKHTLSVTRGTGPAAQTDNCTFDVMYSPSIEVKCPVIPPKQNPTSTISLASAEVQNCEQCQYQVFSGNIEKVKGDDLENLTFSDAGATGTRKYKFRATDKNGDFGECEFDVSFANPITLTCPATTVANQSPNSIFVNITVNDCERCKYKIGNITPTKNGNLFTFADAGASGTKSYTFRATDKNNDYAECEFYVSFVEPVDVTCPTSIVTNQDPSNISVDITVSNCGDNCTYKIGTITPTKNGNTFTFADASSTGTKSYKFRATDGNNTSNYDECDFKVSFASASCATSDWIIDQYNNNKSITFSPKANNGCYHLNTKKACKKVQVEETSGSGSIVINGSSFSCGYVASTSITAKSVMELTVPSTCYVGRLYVHECQ